MEPEMSTTFWILEYLAMFFILLIGAAVLLALIWWAVDKLQTADAVRRNYPVIGRFRHLFTSLGEFFRQYFFAMDREEMPFNRAQRDWVYRAAAGKDNTVAFGSTRNISTPGTSIFVNAAFPPLGFQYAKTAPMVIGPTAAKPYEAPSFFNKIGRASCRERVSPYV